MVELSQPAGANLGTTEELERLAVLRDRGALTDDEFASAKAALLAPPKRSPSRTRPLVLAVCLVAIAASVGLAVFLHAQSPTTPRAAMAAVTAVPNAAPATVDMSIPIGEHHSSGLQRLFVRDTIGMQVPYLERSIGPAKSVSEDVRTYVVDGCEVRITAGKDRTIMKVALPNLSPKCTVNLGGFGFSGPPAHKLTFGMLYSAGYSTTFTADCLELCGNAYEPSVYAYVDTPHANGYVTFIASTEIGGDAAFNASSVWEDAMKKGDGEDFVLNLKFNCTPKYSELAERLFKDVRITSIEIGVAVDPLVESCPNQRR